MPTSKMEALLGTPFALTPKIIQWPGTATPGSGWIVTVIGPAAQGVVKGPQSSMRRWSVLVECVAEPMRIIDTIMSCSLPVTVIGEPLAATLLLTVIVGRGASDPSAANRYGGEKISASRWLAEHLPQSPPPPVNTRPSGSSAPVLWYVRPTV
jgi:hypothetical protein